MLAKGTLRYVPFGLTWGVDILNDELLDISGNTSASSRGGVTRDKVISNEGILNLPRCE
jgi:hypothetical protein